MHAYCLYPSIHPYIYIFADRHASKNACTCIDACIRTYVHTYIIHTHTIKYIQTQTINTLAFVHAYVNVLVLTHSVINYVLHQRVESSANIESISMSL